MSLQVADEPDADHATPLGPMVTVAASHLGCLLIGLYLYSVRMGLHSNPKPPGVRHVLETAATHSTEIFFASLLAAFLASVIPLHSSQGWSRSVAWSLAASALTYVAFILLAGELWGS